MRFLKSFREREDVGKLRKDVLNGILKVSSQSGLEECIDIP